MPGSIVDDKDADQESKQEKNEMIIDLKTGVELEKCPFCGSEPKLRSDNGVSEGTATKMTTPRFWVKCSSDPCGISTRSQEKEEEAVALWNKRS